MLVLSRKENEVLVINKNIEIKILEITGKTVKIGIEAPEGIKVLRKELIEEVSENNHAAKINLGEVDFSLLLKRLKKD